MTKTARLAVDIGGTFTDLVLALPDRSLSAKVLTTSDAPERAVLEGTAAILTQAGIGAADLALVIHGTTLATNALIERKGARTALVTTDGFRDSLEIAYEHRFEQYDLYMERPEPLVARPWRFEVPEREAADGAVLLPMDEDSVDRIGAAAKAEGAEAARKNAFHVIDSTQLCSITANLGDTKTTITHPATTSHGRLSEVQRQAAGISQSLIRVAVGLEHIDDLKADLARGLETL